MPNPTLSDMTYSIFLCSSIGYLVHNLRKLLAGSTWKHYFTIIAKRGTPCETGSIDTLTTTVQYLPRLVQAEELRRNGILNLCTKRSRSWCEDSCRFVSKDFEENCRFIKWYLYVIVQRDACIGASSDFDTTSCLGLCNKKHRKPRSCVGVKQTETPHPHIPTSGNLAATEMPLARSWRLHLRGQHDTRSSELHTFISEFIEKVG